MTERFDSTSIAPESHDSVISAVQAVSPQGFTTQRLHTLLEKIRNKKILVIGDIGIDRYTVGVVERISPEAPVPIVLVKEEKLKLGLAANVADNIHSLGGVPYLVGIVGNDRGADDFRNLLSTSGIQSQHLIVDDSRRTVLKERIVSDGQQLLRVDYESHKKLDSKVEMEILEGFKQLLPQVDAIIVEDYAKGFATPSMMSALYQEAASSGKLIAADPNLVSPVEFFHGATILTPNTKEAEHLSGIKIQDDTTLCQAGAVLLRKTSCLHVVITRGKEGMAVFTRGNPVARLIPTYAREVYDVSGAGDTVISAMILALTAGASVEEASIFGNLAAGIVVGKSGTATVSPIEIQNFHSEVLF